MHTDGCIGGDLFQLVKDRNAGRCGAEKRLSGRVTLRKSRQKAEDEGQRRLRQEVLPIVMVGPKRCSGKRGEDKINKFDSSNNRNNNKSSSSQQQEQEESCAKNLLQ